MKFHTQEHDKKIRAFLLESDYFWGIESMSNSPLEPLKIWNICVIFYKMTQL